MIILEGPDGAGKTTLANDLARRFNYRYHAFGPPQHPPLREYLGWLVDQPDNQVVVDRFHLGEHVYGPIYRGKSQLDPQSQWAIEMALKVRGATLVYVIAPLWALQETLLERGDDMVDVEDLARVVSAYDPVITGTSLRACGYDRTRPDRDRALASIVNLTHHSAKRAQDYRAVFPSMPGSGSLYPDVVLVGERLNPRKASEAYGVPFALGPAGQWLSEALRALWWSDRTYVTNSVKPDGDSHMVCQEIRYLGNPITIALGHTASKALEAHGIDHQLVPHPQYHRRFHWREGAGHYAQGLDEARRAGQLARSALSTLHRHLRGRMSGTVSGRGPR